MTPPGSVRVAAVQLDLALGDREANLAAILARLEEAAALGARLVAFPECALTGYAFADRAEALACAEPIPGPSTARVAEACARLGVHAVYGLLEREGEKLYNACALVGPGGLVASYRKVHLPYMGADRFVDPGDRPFEVVEAAGLRIGLFICYDAAFPEAGRVLTLLGADVLVLPTNWPTLSECAAEHVVPARAFENVVYVVAVNRVGEERGVRYVGRSSIVDPVGKFVAKADPEGETILVADVDPSRSRAKRLVRIPGQNEVDRIGDRRPELYRSIVEPKRPTGG